MFGFLTQTKAVKRRVQTLVQLNLELAKLEGKQKATSLGIAGGLAIGAAVLVVYGIGGASFAAGAGLSGPVESAVDGVVEAIARDLEGGSHA